MRLSIALSLFLNDVCAGKTNETPVAYKAKLNKMLSILGDLEIEFVTPADLERFRITLLSQATKTHGRIEIKGPLSPWYVHGVIQTARHFWRWAHASGLSPTDPAMHLRAPRLPRARPKAISRDVFDRLLEAATRNGAAWERARNVAFLMLLWDTGGRLGEIIHATLDNLDLETGVIVTTGKGDQERYLIASEATLGSLNQWLELRAMILPRGEYLFISASGKSRGKPLTRSGVYAMLSRLAKAAGLPPGTRLNPHSFRHGFVMRSLDNGARLDEVSQLAGHSSIRVTADIYGQRDLAYLRQVHERTSPAAGMKTPRIMPD